jgi:hypothetical protein
MHWNMKLIYIFGGVASLEKYGIPRRFKTWIHLTDCCYERD